jgi:hypothetical protein
MANLSGLSIEELIVFVVLRHGMLLTNGTMIDRNNRQKCYSQVHCKETDYTATGHGDTFRESIVDALKVAEKQGMVF